jgi:hypothetical protein
LSVYCISLCLWVLLCEIRVTVVQLTEDVELGCVKCSAPHLALPEGLENTAYDRHLLFIVPLGPIY